MRRRSGFTLVELLVAMALIVFIMVILSEAFSVGLESFRRLKAIGDMNEKMRLATIALQSDVAADHFVGKKRVSDPNFWSDGPPRLGFFRIYQGTQAVGEGVDGDGLPSSRAIDHVLHFTVKRRGNRDHHYFRAGVPVNPRSPLLDLGVPDSRYQEEGVYTSQWAEVAYFLKANGANSGSTQLYALYRRERVIVPGTNELNWGGGPPVVSGLYPEYLQVSCAPGGANLYFNDPMDITVPERRLGGGGGAYPRLEDDMVQHPGGPDVAGADLLLTDVISFEISLMLENGSEFVDLYRGGSTVETSPDFWNNVTKFNNGNRQFQAAGGPRVFDTWSGVQDATYNYSAWNVGGDNTSLPLYKFPLPVLDGRTRAPLQMRIIALKVTLRVWNAKTQQARQVSFVQDL